MVWFLFIIIIIIVQIWHLVLILGFITPRSDSNIQKINSLKIIIVTIKCFLASSKNRLKEKKGSSFLNVGSGTLARPKNELLESKRKFFF